MAGVANLTSPGERAALAEALSALGEANPEAVRADAVEPLLRGVAAHHAGCLPAWKAFVEEVFQRKLLKVCVSPPARAQPARGGWPAALRARAKGKGWRAEGGSRRRLCSPPRRWLRASTCPPAARCPPRPAASQLAHRPAPLRLFLQPSSGPFPARFPAFFPASVPPTTLSPRPAPPRSPGAQRAVQARRRRAAASVRFRVHANGWPRWPPRLRHRRPRGGRTGAAGSARPGKIEAGK